ncbi:MAG: prepilin-type N-terminal cleavage/methylation domain-containing protein [Candidatus Riflebacteria bacterium]|nr:prepilin-type N-terminal cleavage/methylation domain-containing protein [Candidatus Riflebacteria bacterium]
MKNTKKQLNQITKTHVGKCSGFTLIEILTVVFLIGIIALPFTNMFMFGVRGSTNNAEHVVAYNLAREKIEEIKGLPFNTVQSDYKNFRDVFLDRPKYDDAYYNEDSFVSYFSDVFTESSLKQSEKATSYKKLKELYPKAYLKPLDLYPNDYDSLRRVTLVEEISESAMPPKLKKIIVLVYNDKNQKVAELRSYIGKHK